MSTNNRIKEFRQNQKLSQAALGDLIGTSSQNVGLIERGERELNVRWMEKFAKALLCEPADLMINSGLSESNAPYDHFPQDNGPDAWKHDLIVYKEAGEIMLVEMKKSNTPATDGNLFQLIDMFMEAATSIDDLKNDNGKIIARTIILTHRDKIISE